MIRAMMKTLLLLGLLGLALAEFGHPEYEHPGPDRPVGMRSGKLGPGQEVNDEDEGPTLLVDIFPPKSKPGDLLSSTDIQEVSRVLDDVTKSTGLMHDRSCAMGIANVKGRKLSNPRYYLSSGMKSSAWQPEVAEGHTAVNLGVKKDWTATGSVGVVTYDIEDTDYKVAVMWSVPFDFNLYDVWFNLKVYPQSYTTGKNMYEQMYYHAGPWRALGWEEREEFGVKVQGVMTHNIHSQLMVFIDTTDFSEDGATQHWSDCDYHAGWVKNYCWRECHSGGYCWVDQRCSTKADCHGEMPCYDSCKKTP